MGIVFITVLVYVIIMYIILAYNFRYTGDIDSVLELVKEYPKRYGCDKVDERIRDVYCRLVAKKLVFESKADLDEEFSLSMLFALLIPLFPILGGGYSYLSEISFPTALGFGLALYHYRRSRKYKKMAEEIERELRMYKVMGSLSSKE